MRSVTGVSEGAVYRHLCETDYEVNCIFEGSMSRWTAMVHLAGAYCALSRITAVQSPLGESANKPNVWPVANWELEQEAHKCRIGSKTNKVRTLHVSPAAAVSIVTSSCQYCS